jgi:hypothetical protein
MNCRESQDEIARREAGLSDPADLAALERHLDSCPACRAASETLIVALGAFARVPPSPAPSGFAGEVWRHIEGRTGPAGAPRSMLDQLAGWLSGIFAFPRLAAGLAAVVAVVAVLIANRSDGPVQVARVSPPASVARAPWFTVIEKAGDVRETALGPDRVALSVHGPGSRLVVAHLGRARYAIMGENGRLELAPSGPVRVASGRAEVEVDHRPGDAPYEVAVDGARITVVGTRFTVVAGSAPRIELAFGRLRVTADPESAGGWGSPPGAQIVLEAGRTLSWTAGAAPTIGAVTGSVPVAAASRSPAAGGTVNANISTGTGEPASVAGPAGERQLRPKGVPASAGSPGGQMSGRALGAPGANQNLNDVFGAGH